MKNIIKYYLPPVLLMGTIFYLSSRQSVTVAQTYILNFIFFKTLHIIEFGVLFFLFFRAFNFGNAQYKKIQNSLKLALLLSILYAMSDEAHQLLVPTREGTLRDIFIDTAGISMAYLFVRVKFSDIIYLL